MKNHANPLVREQQLLHFSQQVQSSLFPQLESIKLIGTTNDASSRRYFKIDKLDHLLAVDSPPGNHIQAFISNSTIFHQFGLRTPKILAVDVQHGFMLVECITDADASSYIHHHANNEQAVYALTTQVMDNLKKLTVTSTSCLNIPLFDYQVLHDELELFPVWFLQQLIEIKLSPQEKVTITDSFELLIQSALEQPKILTHRDFHSRNLLWNETHNTLSILDYQDAVMGPITYDLVSYLRDCYVSYPHELVSFFCEDFLQYCTQKSIVANSTKQQWKRWFDLMGVQRHLKVLGIFSRLYLRDNKPNYLGYLPYVLDSVLQVIRYHHEFAKLVPILEKCVPILLPLVANAPNKELILNY